MARESELSSVATMVELSVVEKITGLSIAIRVVELSSVG